MKPLLRLDDIYKRFGSKEVLQRISLDIQRGEIISLLGKSGSGKSTLLNVIAGFESPQQGSVTLGAREITHTPANKRDIGFVFQNYALFPHMNVLENITFGISHLPKKEQRSKAAQLLELVQLQAYANSYPHQLSGGQQQRIALIRAMALEPELILLDEPFSGIDAILKTQIQKQLLQILRATQKTALIVTHDAKEAMAMSDKIIYLENGRITQYDTPENIYRNPKTKEIATSFGVANFLQRDGKLYCLRPEACSLARDGEFPVNVTHCMFEGERFNVEVRLQNTFLRLFCSSRPQNNQLRLSIDWDKAVELEKIN